MLHHAAMHWPETNLILVPNDIDVEVVWLSSQNVSMLKNPSRIVSPPSAPRLTASGTDSPQFGSTDTSSDSSYHRHITTRSQTALSWSICYLTDAFLNGAEHIYQLLFVGKLPMQIPTHALGMKLWRLSTRKRSSRQLKQRFKPWSTNAPGWKIRSQMLPTRSPPEPGFSQCNEPVSTRWWNCATAHWRVLLSPRNCDGICVVGTFSNRVLLY